MKRLPSVSERFDTDDYCKGEDSSKATDEEKRICQKVTGNDPSIGLRLTAQTRPPIRYFLIGGRVLGWNQY